MSELPTLITILIADDDPDDRDMLRDALKESYPSADIRIVSNGEELMDYLRRRMAVDRQGPAPSLILPGPEHAAKERPPKRSPR